MNAGRRLRLLVAGTAAIRDALQEHLDRQGEAAEWGVVDSPAGLAKALLGEWDLLIAGFAATADGAAV
ncbi:MAG TPA: hypothetical protein VFY24_04535, partial [Azospira sp.]|nr:hypothetical protein [Azospira sp.]